jgi:hypothetical protein
MPLRNTNRIEGSINNSIYITSRSESIYRSALLFVFICYALRPVKLKQNQINNEHEGQSMVPEDGMKCEKCLSMLSSLFRHQFRGAGSIRVKQSTSPATK